MLPHLQHLEEQSQRVIVVEKIGEAGGTVWSVHEAINPSTGSLRQTFGLESEWQLVIYAKRISASDAAGAMPSSAEEPRVDAEATKMTRIKSSHDLKQLIKSTA